MLLRGLFFSAFCFISGITAWGQSVDAPYYFVTIERDTVFCKSLDYATNTKGFLDRVRYETMDGKLIDRKGKNKVPEIVTFYMDGKTYDKIPFNLDDENGEYIYSERKVDGKLKVYIDPKVPGLSPVYRFYIRLDDGSYYKVNSRLNMSRYIRPYLNKCEDFKDAYTGEFVSEEEQFMFMIRFYNFLCD